MSAYLLGARLWGAIHRGHRPRAHPSRSLLITLGERRELAELAPRLALPAPGIARLLHVGSLGGGLDGVVEEEPCGRPLAAVALPLRPDTVAILVRQLADILVALHRGGAALGGLQPELIYARPSARGPVVTGLAPRAGMLVRSAPPFPHLYAPPDEERAPPADVFALCALASHWLSGHHPFRGVRRTAQLAAMARGERRPWSGSSACGELIARGLGHARERPSLAEVAAGIGELTAIDRN